MSNKKFKIGETYITSDWFCGGFIRYKVTDRDEKTVSLAEFSDAGFMDGQEEYSLPFDYPIQLKEENGVEYVVIGEYKGHEQRLYAESEEKL